MLYFALRSVGEKLYRDFSLFLWRNIRREQMDNSLLEKLETFYIRFKEIGQLITDPEVIQDMKRYVRLTKEYKDLEEITAAGDRYKAALRALEESREILATEDDRELREMAEEEAEKLEEQTYIL